MVFDEEEVEEVEGGGATVSLVSRRWRSYVSYVYRNIVCMQVRLSELVRAERRQ